MIRKKDVPSERDRKFVKSYLSKDEDKDFVRAEMFTPENGGIREECGENEKDSEEDDAMVNQVTSRDSQSPDPKDSSPRPSCAERSSSSGKRETWYTYTGSPQSVLTEAVQEERKESTSRDSQSPDPLECTMCSDTMTFKYHTHYSTTSIRRSHKGVIMPATETRRVVLACDTMYGVWDNWPANTEHFEMDSIVGGTVKDMQRALVRNYLDLPNRVEIMVIAGINNIAAGETAEQIFLDMEQLKYVVDDYSKKWRHSPPSYVAFCTLIYPPKFCSLYVPPNQPNQPDISMWVPPPNFRNKYDELNRLNNMILKMNEAENLKCVRMDYHGVKRFKSGTIQHKFDTNPGATPIWRETEVFRKLHFTMDIKLKLAEHITTCFNINSGQSNSNSSNH